MMLVLTSAAALACISANKATQAWGLEARVPFLDRAFLEVAMNIDPAEKMIDLKSKPDGLHPRLEKYILRKAFDDAENPYLPSEVLWRQKEQFSDGVGYDWVDGLKAHAEAEVSDADFAQRATRFPFNPPENKECATMRMLRLLSRIELHSHAARASAPAQILPAAQHL
jgi:asparagine synthase (glutamine-hydrolysing)